jgi:hypothetical protein
VFNLGNPGVVLVVIGMTNVCLRIAVWGCCNEGFQLMWVLLQGGGIRYIDKVLIEKMC